MRRIAAILTMEDLSFNATLAKTALSVILWITLFRTTWLLSVNAT